MHHSAVCCRTAWKRIEIFALFDNWLCFLLSTLFENISSSSVGESHFETTMTHLCSFVLLKCHLCFHQYIAFKKQEILLSPPPPSDVGCYTISFKSTDAAKCTWQFLILTSLATSFELWKSNLSSYDSLPNSCIWLTRPRHVHIGSCHVATGACICFW